MSAPKKSKLINDEVCWQCPACLAWKPEQQFYHNKSKPNGLSSYCKECKRTKKYGKVHGYTSSAVPKDQIQLECHLCVYINALKRRKQTKPVCEDLATLREAIEVMRRHSDLVAPPHHWQKKGILALLAEETTPLSVDEMLEWASQSGLMLGRRRLQIQLSKLKRDGLLTNPKRSFWTTTDRANETFSQDTKADWNTEQPARQRTQGGNTEYYCSRCTKYYPVTEFWKNKCNLYGLQHYCKTCQKKYYAPNAPTERTTPV